MGQAAFDLLKNGPTGPESAGQAKDRLASFPRDLLNS